MFELSNVNNAIISIQCKDPIIDLLSNYVAPDDKTYRLSDLLDLIKRDLEDPEKKFLESDLNRFFEAIGMED